MNSFTDKQRKYSLRKLSVGVASVAIATFFLGGQVVSADEGVASETPVATTTAPATETPAATEPSSAVVNIEENFNEEVTVVSEELIDGKTASDVAAADIEATVSQPVVEESKAQVGDLVAVESKVEEPVVTAKEEGNKVTATSETKVTVTSTYKSDASAPLGKQEPVIKTYTTSGVYETPSAYITEKETVTKVTTVENVKVVETTVVSEEIAPTDIVFVIDRSGSMSGAIDSVAENLATFVETLSKKGVKGRYGLATFSDTTYDEKDTYSQFGPSYFTSDVALIRSALENIKLDTGGDLPETPTPAINFVANSYDWSSDGSVNKFVILVTDALAKEDETNGIPTLSNIAKVLKNKGIDTAIIGRSSDQDEYSEFVTATGGVYFDINSDYEKLLTDDVATWIVDSVENTRYYTVVTDEYTLVVEMVAVEKPQAVVPASVKPTECIAEAKPAECAPVAKAAALPATGESSTLGLTSLGLMTVMSVLGLSLKKRKN
ncbi:YSIRK-type signal peptide-containing protein [Streptococcus caprae]|uniref:YSIRK-type signal peptide-containing protein n=1 Tax=Streptococcus caprae TaxID=1640501 RepID=A0ABV8CTG7_9STRE